MSFEQFARVAEAGSVRLHTAPHPTPGAAQVRVRIACCGVCGTDVHSYQDGRVDNRATFGHEWVGHVEQVGAAVRSVAPGDRVSIAVGPPCGACAYCRADLPDQCQQVRDEVSGRDRDAPLHGAFATHLTVSERRVMPVRPELSDAEAALVETTAVCVHALRRTTPAAGSTVVVLGAGPIGLILAQLLAGLDCSVVISEPAPARRAVALALGVGTVTTPAELSAALAGRNGGIGADAVFECTGVPHLLQSAAELVRRGGSLVLLGYPAHPSEVSCSDWQQRELSVVGNLAFARVDLDRAADLLVRGLVDVAPLVSRTVSLAELPATLAQLAGGDPRDLKVLVTPSTLDMNSNIHTH